MPGQTFLYAGPSGDQGVYLLRHLPFDANCVFGTSNWTIWRASAGSSGSAYFTIYPNVLLDAEGDAFDIRQIPTAARTHHQELLDLYYRYVHPTLPILECRQELEGAIAARTVPASLLAAVYSMAVFFWSYSGALRGEPKINREALLSFTYKSVMFETRNPNLRTVQTLLLYLQMPPKLVREPNHPGSWVVTAQVVAVAQEAGLHIDPERLEISPRECKLRRILWWAVYLQDKWFASWLGRPSHISNDQFTVKSLSIMDFTNDWGNVDSAAAPSIQQFISLCHLTPVLADVLDMFYSPKARLEATQQHLALLLASEAASKLQEWQSQHMFTARPQSEDPNAYALIFAYYAIEALIHGALFVCTGSVTSGGVADESQLFEKLLDVLELMLTRNPTGFWLSYCKGNLGIIGSFMLTVFLSSVDEHTLHIRQTVLQRYQRLLEELCVRFEFAALPSVRLNLFFKRLFPEYMDENLEERPSLE